MPPLALVTGSAVPDARIEERVADINEQVDDHDKDDDDGYRTQDDGPVARGDRAIGLVADTRPVEDRLREDGARHHAAEVQADVGDDRDEGVLEGVVQDDAATREALGARGADVVLVEDLKQLRAHDARGVGRRDGSEGDRGKDVVDPILELGVLPAGAGDGKVERTARDVLEEYAEE